VITYFDTSAIIPLLVDEPTSRTCTRLWNEAARVVSVRLLYPEARAALARARRLDRISARQLNAAVDDLDEILAEIDHIEINAGLARTAGDLAGTHGLRGYDAVHLAAASIAADADLVVATGDDELGAAARSLGLAVALTR
jgi:uncharacterized protein